MDSHDKSQPEHLLMSAMPTPNGAMHLGHIAGPYLKMDIIKRGYRQNNKVAHLYGGIDAIDSFIMLKAREEGKTEGEICEYYYSKIVADFKRLHIEFDCFINPLSQRHSCEYKETMNFMVNESIKKSGYIKKEKYPVNTKNEFLPVSFIVGQCPTCRCKITGFVCEECGGMYNPEEIVSEQKFESKLTTNFFASINKKEIVRWISKLCLNDSDKKHACFLLRMTDEMRLTVPKIWGIQKDSDHSFFNYTNNYPYFYYLGELYKKKRGLCINPFEQGSEVRTSLSFGYDNFIAYFVFQENQVRLLKNKKSFDWYLPCHFLTLANNTKFSTSRNHAIWVEKLPKKISIDILRLYLLKINSDNFSQNFCPNDFVRFYNNTAKIINSAINKVGKTRGRGEILFDRLAKLLTERNKYISSENYSAAKLYRIIEKWLAIYRDIEDVDCANWLDGLFLLGYPIMPSICVKGEASHKVCFNDVVYCESRLINYINKNDIVVG